MVSPVHRPWQREPLARHKRLQKDPAPGAEATVPGEVSSHPHPDSDSASPSSVDCCRAPYPRYRSLHKARCRGYCDSAAATHPSGSRRHRPFQAVPDRQCAGQVPRLSPQWERPFESVRIRRRSFLTSTGSDRLVSAKRKMRGGCCGQCPDGCPRRRVLRAARTPARFQSSCCLRSGRALDSPTPESCCVRERRGRWCTSSGVACRWSRSECAVRKQVLRGGTGAEQQRQAAQIV